MLPETHARQQIDALLVHSGWIVQDYKKLNLSADRGVAVHEVPLVEGVPDYLIFVDRKPAGVVEAKKAGVTLSGVAEQSGYYAETLPRPLREHTTGALLFLNESTGVETFFREERDPNPRSRRVFAFHQPETLSVWLARPGNPPRLACANVFRAPDGGYRNERLSGQSHHSVEHSFAENRPANSSKWPLASAKHSPPARRFTGSPSMPKPGVDRQRKSHTCCPPAALQPPTNVRKQFVLTLA